MGSHQVAMKLGDHLKMGVTVSRSEAERIVHSAGVDTVLGKTTAMFNSMSSALHVTCRICSQPFANIRCLHLFTDMFYYFW